MIDLNKIPICISGIDYVVGISTFNSFKIIEEKLIGDTYFIKCDDSSSYGTFSLSVHKNFYDAIKRDIKISKILG